MTAKRKRPYHWADDRADRDADESAHRPQLQGSRRDDILFVNDISVVETAAGGLGHDLILGDRRPLDTAPQVATEVHGQDGLTLHVIRGTDHRTIGGFYDKVFLGDAGDDWLMSGAGNDVVHGGDGDDVVYGEGGGDRLYGGDGNDILSGDNLSDSLFGTVDQHGNDTIDGGAGNDRLFGNGGDDQLEGGPGDDELHGDDPASANWRGGADELRGGDGADRLFGQGGDDQLHGGRGDDVLAGGGGSDWLDGGDGDDRLYADIANLPEASVRGTRHPPADDVATRLTGRIYLLDASTLPVFDDLQRKVDERRRTPHDSGTANQLYGGEGNDLLVSGAGRDWMEGGSGADVYVAGRMNGHDIIAETGTDSDGKDVLRFASHSNTSEMDIRQDGSDLILAWTAGGRDHSVRILDQFAPGSTPAVALFHFDGGEGLGFHVTAAEMSSWLNRGAPWMA